MTYGFLITVNMLAYLGWNNPLTHLNLFAAGILTGFWIAELANRYVAKQAAE